MTLRASMLIGLAALAATLVSMPAPVAAQSEVERTALARELFAEGTAHLEAERFEEAAGKLERAYELRAAPGIGFNLAAAFEQLGRLVEALELLRAVLSDPSTSNDIKRLARRARARIEPRIARLTIRVPDGHEGTDITLDGREVLRAALDVAAPVDPGEHVIVLSRDGTTVSAERVMLADGGSEEVVLYSEALTPVELPLDEEAEGPESGSVFREWWFWTIVGGVVLAGAIVAIALAASGPEDPAQGTAGVIVWP